jgi:ribbon-helix-helix CopG family protein
MLPDDLLARLRHEARRRGTSVAEVVRGAVEREVEEPPGGRELSIFGIGASGRPGLSARVDDELGEIFDARDRRRRDADS